MARSRMIRLAVLGAWLVAAPRAAAQNFVATDSRLAQAAEQARVRSAMFWSGRELPGRWFEPCPISWWPAAAAGRSGPSGRTTFTIAGNEVFNWRMSVFGPSPDVLVDVIPHEVDHMVRASLVRRPIYRWLDEGCAALLESAAAHDRLRQIVATEPTFRLSESFLGDRTYAPEAFDRARQYAVGFSVAEFLLERKGPAALLALQGRVDAAEAALEDVYGLSVEELNREWRDWFLKRSQDGTGCRGFGCQFHESGEGPFLTGSEPGPSPTRLLTVFTATWCGSCRRFWKDLATDAAFRAAVTSHYHIQAVDVDREPVRMAATNVTSLPTFMTAEGPIQGYRGANWLLAQLGLKSAAPDKPLPTSEKPAVAPTAAQATPVTPAADGLPAAGATVSGHETPAVAPSQGRQIMGPDSAARALVTGRVAEPPAAANHPIVNATAQAAPWVLTALQLAGVIGGGVATGGVGGLAAAVAWAWLRRRIGRAPPGAGKEVGVTIRAPFPRQLDEAGELLALRQSEGRVATLDALRGMFLDDEAGKLLESGTSSQTDGVRRLMSAIDARVDEVAPLSTCAV